MAIDEHLPRGSMKDGRQHPRISIAVDVDVASGSNFYAGRTRDLSLGGLFVETDVGLPIGIQIEVKLKLPKGTFNVPCEVVWALSDRAKRTLGLGVRFLDLADGARRAIEAFMSIRKPVAFETPEPDDDAPTSGPPPLPTNETASKRDTHGARPKAATPKASPTGQKPLPPRPPNRTK